MLMHFSLSRQTEQTTVQCGLGFRRKLFYEIRGQRKKQ
jgi:hypothetical protein